MGGWRVAQQCVRGSGAALMRKGMCQRAPYGRHADNDTPNACLRLHCCYLLQLFWNPCSSIMESCASLPAARAAVRPQQWARDASGWADARLAHSCCQFQSLPPPSSGFGLHVRPVLHCCEPPAARRRWPAVRAAPPPSTPHKHLPRCVCAAPVVPTGPRTKALPHTRTGLPRGRQRCLRPHGPRRWSAPCAASCLPATAPARHCSCPSLLPPQYRALRGAHTHHTVFPCAL